jgi:hypothetical protein
MIGTIILNVNQLAEPGQKTCLHAPPLKHLMIVFSGNGGKSRRRNTNNCRAFRPDTEQYQSLRSSAIFGIDVAPPSLGQMIPVEINAGKILTGFSKATWLY